MVIDSIEKYLKSGEIRNVEVFSNIINISNKAYLHSSIHDITETVEAETELKLSEERFRAMIEGAPDPIFIQTNYCFAYLNKRAIELFGAQTPGELLGTPVMERFHPDYHDRIKKRIKTLNQDRKEVLTPLEQKEKWRHILGIDNNITCR